MDSYKHDIWHNFWMIFNILKHTYHHCLLLHSPIPTFSCFHLQVTYIHLCFHTLHQITSTNLFPSLHQKNITNFSLCIWGNNQKQCLGFSSKEGDTIRVIEMFIQRGCWHLTQQQSLSEFKERYRLFLTVRKPDTVIEGILQKKFRNNQGFLWALCN